MAKESLKTLAPAKVLIETQVPTRLINTALMADSREVERILSALRTGKCESDWQYMDDDDEAGRDRVGDIAIISILNGLTYRGYGWWRTAYIDIREEFRAALADPGVRAIIFDIDSPGGEVAGVFDLVDEIYRARGTKPIYAMANETALSAAYAIASAADKVFLSRTACVGSVGVIAVHVDQSKYDQAEGFKYTAVYAGDRKNEFSPHEPLKKEAKNSLQDVVDSFYSLFVETVARNRGLTADEVRDTKARTYSGAEAVVVGLADDVLSWEEMLQRIENDMQGGGQMKFEELKAGLIGLLAEDPEGVAEALKAMGFSPVLADVAAPETAAATPENNEDANPPETEGPADAELRGKEAGAVDAVKIATDIIELCALGGRPEMAKELIASRVSVDDARKKILEAKAASGPEILSTVGAISTGEVNPLLVDAKRRAEGK